MPAYISLYFQLLYGYIYITFFKWQSYRDGEWISGCQGLVPNVGGMGGM